MLDPLFEEFKSDDENSTEDRDERLPGKSQAGGVAVQQDEEKPVAEELEAVTTATSVLGAIEAAANVREEKLKRLQADFDNLKKRSESEQKIYRRRATAALVSRLLPIIDNFERALAAGEEAPDAESLRDGVVLIFRQLLDELRKEGLEAIDSVGQLFDPEYHEAVETESGTGQAPNHVIEEFQRGYRMRGELLRPALVKVSIDSMDEMESQDWGEDF